MTKWKYAVLLFLIGFFTYLPSLGNELFWDDEQFIYNNQYVRTFAVRSIFTENTIAGAGEVSNYYRPLTSLSFAIDYQIWGDNPVGYHLTNTVLHSLAGVLLFFLLMSLAVSPKTATIISTIFLIHPIQTEAVVYANSRGDSLFALFLFFSLLCFSWLLQKNYLQLQWYNLRFKCTPVVLSVCSVSSFVFALLSKEISLGGSMLFLGILLFFWLHNQKKQHYAVRTGQLLLLAIVGISALYFTLRNTALSFEAESNYFLGTPYGDSVLVRILTFCKVIWIYLGLLLIPYPLHMERTTTIVTSLASPWIVLTLVLCSSLAFLGYTEWKKTQRSYIWLGTFWFFAMLGPVSGIIPINDILYEHWLYTPLVGFCLVLYGLYRIVPTALQNTIAKYMRLVLGTIFASYILLTLRQIWIWQNPIRFYTYTLQFAQTARLRNNLAMAYAANGQEAKAIEEYTKAIASSDSYPQTHYNLARSYLALQQTPEAITAFRRALELSAYFAPAYTQLIPILLEANELELAKQYIDQFRSHFPEEPLVLFFEGYYYAKIQEKSKADAAFAAFITATNSSPQAQQLVRQVLSQP